MEGLFDKPFLCIRCNKRPARSEMTVLCEECRGTTAQVSPQAGKVLHETDTNWPEFAGRYLRGELSMDDVMP